jgi:hypothetical protein
MIGSAANLVGNNVFGCRDGVRLEGIFTFLSITGGLIDGCRYGIRGVAGCGDGTLRASGVYIASNTVVFGSNTTSEAVTLESNCVRFDAPSADVDIIFSGCKIGGANGDLFRITDGVGKVNVIINGNKLSNPGRFAHSLLINVTGGAGTFVNGETVTGGTSGATATFLKRVGNDLYVSSVVGVFTAAETVTGGTSGATGTVNTLTDGAVYYVCRFIAPLSNLTITNNDIGFARYPLHGGLLATDARDIKYMGNSHKSPFSTARPMVTVTLARSIVEGYNSSDMVGTSFSDLVITSVTKPPIVGPSGWDRQTGAISDGRSTSSASIATTQNITDATLTTIVFGTEALDTRAEYNNATGIFTASEQGLYNISAEVPHDATVTAGNVWRLTITTTTDTFVHDYIVPSAALGAISLAQASVRLRVGDTARATIQRVTGAGAFQTRTTGSAFRVTKAR